MSIVVNIATFPGRISQASASIRSLSSQVHKINIVLNEYAFVPDELKAIPGANYIFPPRDLKDVGKFYPRVDEDDDVFLCDDDILYPPDYVNRMMDIREKFSHINPILGLHGVLYSDYYDGKHGSGRLVDVFYRALDTHRLVNQVGTGTVHCKGYQMPTFGFMEGSERFVDVRFARHSLQQGYPSVCVAREAGWLRQIEVEGSIFQSFTMSLPDNVIREIQDIAGFRYLSTDVSLSLMEPI